MKFVLVMAWREMRASWRRLALFFLCIAIGVGSIVSLRSLTQSVNVALRREARSFLAADAQVTSNRPWTAEVKAVLERYRDSPMVEEQTESLELPAMLRLTGDSDAIPKAARLKAVQPEYPLYGEMLLAGGQRYDHSLLDNRGALAHTAAMTQLNLRVGDQVRIGSLTFTIRGLIEKEPGSAINFNPAPRVIVAYDDVVAAGLTASGSRANYRVSFKARGDQDRELTNQLRRELASQPGIEVRSFRQAEDRLSRTLERVENFLGLIGLVILLLGGIGVSSVTRVFVQQKMKTIAILKCLGGKNRRVLGAYLAQVMALGVFGGLLGLGLAEAATVGLPEYLADRIPFNVDYGVTWQAASQGLGAGVLIAMLFALPPLLEIRRVKPILVLRDEPRRTRRTRRGDEPRRTRGTRRGDEPRKARREWRGGLPTRIVERIRNVDLMRLGTGLLSLLALVALSSWHAGSLTIGALFLGGLAITTVILSVAGWLLMRSLRRVSRLPSFVLRHGVNSLYRPGNQTRVILLAVGLGAFFVIAVRLMQVNLLGEINLDRRITEADLYVINIQPNERAEADELITRATGASPRLIPALQGQVIALNGAPGPSDDESEGGGRRLFRRDQRLTYRSTLEPEETIVAGKFWEPTAATEAENSIAEISIDEGMSADFNLGVGDSLTFDIMGKQITGRISSVRRVDRRGSAVRFPVVFRPGNLEDMPQMLIGAVKGPQPGEKRTQLVRELTNRFITAWVIDAFDVVDAVRTLIDNVSLAVTFAGGFVFLAGLLILIGSIAMTKLHRLYEAAILRTLGAKKKLIILITLVEYGVLGLLAGVIGSSAAIGLTWAISRYGLEISWRLVPSVNIAGVGATLLLVTTVGVLASWDVMVKKPLGILRAE